MRKLGLTQRVEFVTDRNERRDCLDQAWTSLLIEHGFCPVPLPNCVEDVKGLLGAIEPDGVILTGGNDLAHLPGARNVAKQRDAFERRLLDVCDALEIPVLGVCRGLQLMVAHYGGALSALSGHAATRHSLAVHNCSELPLTAHAEVNSFHDFGVAADDLGPDLRPIGIAPDGSVEAVAHKCRRQYGIMWHPERPPHDPGDGAILRKLFGEGNG